MSFCMASAPAGVARNALLPERSLQVAVALSLLLVAFGCRTARPPAAPPDRFKGIASWYGEEFAGRTTANGEIFDPTRLTAAHRTLPFGSVLDVTNPKTGESVRVRVNDRGPFIANRVIDLSYAAARQIGLIQPGVGEVEVRVVRLGGDREAPAPLEIAIGAPPPVAPAAGAPPRVEFPLPGGGSADTTVERVDLEVQRGGVITRRQVSPDGRTIEDVPVGGGEASRPVSASPATRPTARAPVVPRSSHFFVQVGAFAVEENARALQSRLTQIGQPAWIDRGDLYRVRIGPFLTREEAVSTRSALEASGVSAIILSE
jgi:rare lipoprotein A